MNPKSMLRTIIGMVLCQPVMAAVPEPAPTVIPIQLQAGDAQSITGEIDGKRGVFLFDSGWGLSAVSPSMASLIGCKPWGQLTGFRAIGEAVHQQQCQPVTVRLGGKALHLPRVGLVDLQRYMPAGSPTYAGAIGLDAFAGKTVTLRSQARQIVIETASSLKARTTHATEVPIRLAREAQGASLSAFVGIPVASGMLWMELDTGNTGPSMVDRHVAPLLGLDPAVAHGQHINMQIVRGIAVRGQVQVLDLIMDGLIGRDFLNSWDLTLDLARGKGWLTPAAPRVADVGRS